MTEPERIKRTIRRYRRASLFCVPVWMIVYTFLPHPMFDMFCLLGIVGYLFCQWMATECQYQLAELREREFFEGIIVRLERKPSSNEQRPDLSN